MSMPVGHTCTQMSQETQWPRPSGPGVGLLAARAARLAAVAVVGDDQRVVVEHRALEARVRAHVLADLLAHPPRIAVGGEAVEADPEHLPGTEREGEHLVAEQLDGREVAHEGEARPQAHRNPGGMLAGLDAELARGERPGVELGARIAVALEEALDPEEDLGVDRLRAGIAAPEPSRDRGEEEERHRGDDEERGEVDEILRPEDQAEDVELARAEIEEDRLAVVPG